MVQLPFRVPPLDIRRPTFLQELVPEWRGTLGQLPDVVALSVIADYGLQRNPRQLKRLINAFLVVKRVIELKGSTSDDQLLLATIGLQLRWPDRYRQLQAAVLAGSEHPLGALADLDDSPLARYVDRFFATTPGVADELRRIMEFTTALAPESEGELTPGRSSESMSPPSRRDAVTEAGSVFSRESTS